MRKIQSASDFDIRGAQTFGVLVDFEFNFGAFLQRAVALRLDGRVMHENVFAAIFLFDKAEAFGVIEPFNGAFSHNNLSTFFDCRELDASLNGSPKCSEVLLRGAALQDDKFEFFGLSNLQSKIPSKIFRPTFDELSNAGLNIQHRAHVR